MGTYDVPAGVRDSGRYWVNEVSLEAALEPTLRARSSGLQSGRVTSDHVCKFQISLIAFIVMAYLSARTLFRPDRPVLGPLALKISMAFAAVIFVASEVGWSSTDACAWTAPGSS